MTEYEQHLREQLVALQREYQERAKPIIDQLVRLESLKPPPPIFIDKDVILSQATIEQIQRWCSPDSARDE